MDILIGSLRLTSILCAAFVCGKLVSKLRLPAILGWLIAGIVFGPYLAGVVTFDVTDSVWYKVLIKFFECFAGVMIGREIVFFTVISVVSATYGSASLSPWAIVGIVLIPFVVGILTGLLASFLMKHTGNARLRL